MEYGVNPLIIFSEKVQECESRLGSTVNNAVIDPVVSTDELFVFTADICDPETDAYKEVGKAFCDEVRHWVCFS